MTIAAPLTLGSVHKRVLGRDIWFGAPGLDSQVPELSRIRHNLILDVEHLRNADLPGLAAWRARAERLRSLEGIYQLAAVNDFVNNAITYVDDWQHYQISDHWALLSETVLDGQGDCEDIAIAKLETLAYLGWDPGRLALLIGRLSFPNGDVLPHAVGACFDDIEPPFDPVILGNVDRRMHRESDRSDFSLAYAAIAVEDKPEWLVTHTRSG